MKKILVLLFLFMAFWGRAQSGISYQAVLMSPTAGQLPGADNPKSPLVDASICLRFSITSDPKTTPITTFYQETLSASTNEFGVVNAIIGTGTSTGVGSATSFGAISWNGAAKYLKVELDHTGSCNGSNTFSGVSEQPFTTVPFALYALNSGSGGGGGSTTTTLTGDVSGSATTGSITTTITNDAVTTDKIANSSVTNAKLQNSSITINGNPIPLGGTATIASSPIGSALASSKILVGNAAGAADAVNMSGDVSINNLGVTAIGTDKVVAGMLAPDAVTSAKILDNTITNDDLNPSAAIDFTKLNIQKSNILSLGIDKADFGLSNVDNTSDLTKPISTATQSALALKAPSDSPTFTGTVTGITKAMVGLSDVDNTTDLTKPISKATQSALALKAPSNSPNFTGTTTLNGNIAVRSVTSGTLTDKFTVNAITGNTVIAGDTSLGGYLAIARATTIGLTLGVAGDLSVNTDKFKVVATNGNTTVAGTLNAGASTLNSAVVTNDTSVGGDLNITGLTTAAAINATNISASGTLGVTGPTTLNGNLAVRGLTSGVLTDKFTVNASNGDTTVDGKLKVNEIVDKNALIDNTGNNNIHINSISGRFKFPVGQKEINVYNSNVNVNSIILCTVTKNTYNTNNYILSVDADNLFFKVNLLSNVAPGGFEINFLIINNNL